MMDIWGHWARFWFHRITYEYNFLLDFQKIDFKRTKYKGKSLYKLYNEDSLNS